MRTLSLLLVAAAAAAAADGPVALPAAAESLAASDQVVVYRGVPRKSEPRPWDAKGALVEFGGSKFDSQAQRVPPGEAKELARLFAAKSFRPFGEGVSRSLGFHTDFVLEWTTAGQTWRAAFCFDSNEVKVFKFPAGKPDAAQLEAHYEVDATGDDNPREGFRRKLAAHFRR